MESYTLSINTPLTYHYTGKFEAPSPEWIHLTRELSDYEFILVTKGTLYIADHKQRYEVKEGEYLLMGPTPNQYGYASSACTFYWLHISPHTIGEPEDSAHITLPATAAVPKPERLLVLLKQLQDANRRYRNMQYNNYAATTILTELDCQLKASADAHARTGGKEQLYTDIIDYITWNISKPIKVSDIAAYYGYNEKYLTTFFKNQSGIPLKTYILNEKMEMAKYQLSDSNQTVSQIAYSLGFADNHNFSTCFKKITGFTPSGYRECFSKRMLFHE
jgi:AraC-like DNA-binding protein